MRTIIVTGAARGLGAAIADRLRADGFSVLATDLAQAPDVTRLDVRSETEWADIAARFEATGEPWGLVNCAARTLARDLFEIETDEWDDVFATNVRGAFLGIRTVGPILRTRAGGRIVNVSSDAAFKGRGVIGAHYATSKAAVIALTRRAAAALAADGVTVNAVAPGTIDGETLRELAGDRADALAAEAALGRLAEPREIAAVVGWLVSDDASYVTGTTVIADGGAGL